ncbi:MAG TPA: ferric reductase-like transmembrane domain-containing protein [Candidatus Thermoplasmatota archaeon]|nr:ferric reductase-like transmembrane domain-containing protein [Candidatus Thermoplasmatota archaeon]
MAETGSKAAAEEMEVEVSARRMHWTTILAVGLMVAGCLAGAGIAMVTTQTPLTVRATGTPLTEGQEVGGILGLVATWAMLGTLFLGWAWTGVPLMMRWKSWRIDVHNWISIGVLAFAGFHTAQFMVYDDYRGWLSGWLSNVLLLALFVTGWWRAYWVRRWGRPTWRWVHWELALGAIAFALMHWFLIEDGKEALGIAEGF